MANPNAPFGARAIGLIGGKPVTAAAAAYSLPSASAGAIGIGSLVKLTGTGRDVIIAASGDDAIVGVAVGFKWRDVEGNVVYRRNWPTATVTFASEDAEVLVVDDPQTVFEMQSDATGIAEVDVGQFFAITVGAPNANGLAQTVATGVTGTVTTLKLIGLGKRSRAGVQNAYGAYAVGEFMLAEHAYAAKLLAQ